MLRTTTILISFFVVLTGISCSNNKKSNEVQFDSDIYLKNGKEISMEAQKALIGHLSKAIEEGGTEYAVQFCNLKAINVIDSISRMNNCRVSRVSDKNRNPDNGLTTQSDSRIWEYYAKGIETEPKSDTVLNLDQNIVYYSPIRIGMPTCLKCHGEPGLDINESTIAIIDSLYPKDLAKNYKSGELRGLWKIEFPAFVQ